MLRKSDVIYNVKSSKKHKIQRLVRMHSNHMEDIDEAYAGDICAVFGIDCSTGDSFVSDKELKLTMVSAVQIDSTQTTRGHSEDLVSISFE